MELIKNLSETVMNTPKNVQGTITSAIQTTNMTNMVRQDMEAGRSPAEVLKDRLPAQANLNSEALEIAAEQICKGVEAFYQAKDSKLTGSDLNKYMDERMNNMTDLQRAKFLLGLLAMAPEETVTGDELQRVTTLRDAESVSGEDVAFLTQLTQKALSGTAGVLARSTVDAVAGSIGKLDADHLKAFADMGPEMAKAYGLACYIEAKIGHTPWGKDSEKLTGNPYEIGLAAANGVESSKLLALYAKGKLTKEVLEEKLNVLFDVTWNQVVMDLLITGVELTVAAIVGDWVCALLLMLGAAPLITLFVGAAVGIAAGVAIEPYIRSSIELFADIAQGLFNGVKMLFTRIFGEDAAIQEETQEETAEADTEYADSAEKAEEDEEENEEEDEEANAEE